MVYFRPILSAFDAFVKLQNNIPPRDSARIAATAIFDLGMAGQQKPPR